MSGTVTNALTGTVVPGATVAVGSAQATTDASGAYSLTGLAEGSATIRSTLAGYTAYEAAVTLTSGSNTADIAMTREGVVTFPQYALYAPAGADRVRAVILVLGGPRTTGFATGGPLGAPDPEAEASGQLLGQQLRAFATDSGLALLGTSQQGLPDEAATDQALLQALASAAASASRPELASAPIITIGVSSGGPTAFGFMLRNPDRVAATGLRNPNVLGTAPASSRQVPVIFWLSADDEVISPTYATQTFEANRAQRAIWGIAVEPNTRHSGLTAEGRDAIMVWLAAVVGARVPATAGGALRQVDEASGWLGDRTTGDAAPFAAYAGDPLTAAWLPTAAVAAQWEALVQ